MASPHRRLPEPGACQWHVWWSLLIGLLLALSVLPAVAASSGVPADPAGSSRTDQAQAPNGNVVAFLREGNIWLMDLNGANQRQMSFYDHGVHRYSWSPSGRYLLVAHGGTSWDVGGPDPGQPLMISLIDLQDERTVDIGALDMSQGTEAWRFPTWAQDADALMLVTTNTGQHTLNRLDFDGTQTPLATYDVRPICGGPDGPFSVYRDLYWELELGSYMVHDIYPVAFWWSQRDVVLVNEDCATGYLVDLATGVAESYPQTIWADVQGNLALVTGGMLAASEQVGLFDLTSRSTVPLPAGATATFGRDGLVYLTTREEVGPSEFTSPFDDGPMTYADASVTIWRSDTNGTSPVEVATLPVYGTSLPSVLGDGSALVLGAVENPTDMISTDTSAFDRYSSTVYGEHLTILRVETTTGEVTELATNGYRPLAQPATTVTTLPPDPTAPATIVDSPSEPPATMDGLIAYVGQDGNIWTIQPDGTNATQVTTDGTLENGLFTYGPPSWSHDGRTLVFAGGFQGSPHGVMLSRDGVLTPVPGTEGCGSPAFAADDQRILFICPVMASYDIPLDLGTNPKMAFVTSANLDGTDMRGEVPFTTDGTGIAWGDSKSIHYPQNIDVNPADGSFIVSYSGFHKSGLHRFDAEGMLLGSFEMPGDDFASLGPYWASLLPDGQHLAVTVCASGCMPNAGNLSVFEVQVTDLQGTVVARWTSMSFPDNIYWGVDASPTGDRLVTSFEPAASDEALLRVFDGPDSSVDIGTGRFPAWQPVGATPVAHEGTGQMVEADSTAFADVHLCQYPAEELMTNPRSLNPPPEHCRPVAGVVIQVTGPDGTLIGTCTTADYGGCSVPAPSEVELTLTLDPATLPASVVPYENPRTIVLPAGVWDGIVTGFVVLLVE